MTKIYIAVETLQESLVCGISNHTPSPY